MINKSPWVSFFNSGGCNGCIIECLTLITPKYDIERFGCVLKGSARHADILIVTGPLTEQSRARLKNIYEQMAPEKKVIAVGNCAISGGIFRECYNIKSTVSKEVPIELYVPGCPPRPEAIIFGLKKLLGGMDDSKKS